MCQDNSDMISTVFASINLQRGEAIDAQDFLSLSLCTAMLAIRRVEHFQSWIFEEFGKTKEVFKNVFSLINADNDRMNSEKQIVLTPKIFVEGVQKLGYPCGSDAV